MKVNRDLKHYTISIDAIQALAANNLNRDSNGSPKTVDYGNVRRARVSSQSWKRAMREWMEEHLDTDTGIRTLNVPQLIVDEIMSRDIQGMTEENAIELTDKALSLAGISHKPNKKNGRDQTTALFFIGSQQVRNLVDAMLDNDISEKDRAILAAEAVKSDTPLGAALFGKMVADKPELNVDAAAQVAHPFGVSRAVPQFDYFTALDDYGLEDHAGAAMIQDNEFSTSVLYRHAAISLTQLEKNLGDKNAVEDAVKKFVEAFIKSIPSGKQNGFTTHSLPDIVVVSIYDDGDHDLASAFVKPVESTNLVVDAIDRMVSYAEAQHKAYDVVPVASYVVTTGETDSASKLGEVVSLSELVSLVGDKTKQLVDDSSDTADAVADNEDAVEDADHNSDAIAEDSIHVNATSDEDYNLPEDGESRSDLSGDLF